MKVLLSFLLGAGLFFVALKAEVLPWRLVTVEEIKQVRQILSELRAQVQTRPAPRPHFARDPNYRTSLEKTTVIGRPEGARSREFGQ